MSKFTKVFLLVSLLMMSCNNIIFANEGIEQVETSEETKEEIEVLETEDLSQFETGQETVAPQSIEAFLEQNFTTVNDSAKTEENSVVSKSAARSAVGSTVAQIFPDQELAKVIAQRITGGDVNGVITQESIDNYTNLSINGNYITDLTGIEYLVNVNLLFMMNIKTTTIQDNICSMTKVRSIYLVENSITHLPDCFGNISDMRFLNIQENRLLTTLPESIGNLDDLQTINLTNDFSLTHLPESFGDLQSLRNINIRTTGLVTLPESFGNLPNLDTLYINESALTSLPESIGNTPKLKSVTINSSNLQIIPESIGNLSVIETLSLSSNKIVSLPESIGNLTTLNALHIERNQLTSLPRSIENLKNTFFGFTDNLLPTTYGDTLNTLGMGNEVTSYAQSKLTLKADVTPYEVVSGSGLTTYDFASSLKIVDAAGSDMLTVVNPPVPYTLSTSRNYVFDDYVDENGASVNIDDYVKDGVVQREATLFASVRATGDGLFLNTSENAITEDKVQLNLSIKKYQLSYHLNGGVGTVPDLEELIEAATGTIATNPSKEGHVFTGWNTAIDGTGTNWISGTTPMVPANTILYAQWRVATYNLLFDMNGALLPAPTMQELEEGQVGVAVTTPERYGYIFNGWNTAIDGTGTNWVPGTTPMVPTDTTIYAQWEAITYNLLFDMNGALETAPTMQVLEEGQVGVAVENPTREGYTFTGWNTAIDGTGTNWIPGTTPMTPANTTLYAQWSAIDQVTITYNTNGGVGSVEDTTVYYVNEDIVVKDGSGLTNGDLVFVGWNTAADGSGRMYASNSIMNISKDTAVERSRRVYNINSLMNISKNTKARALTNTTLYAQWEKKSTISNALPQTGNSNELHVIGSLLIALFILRLKKFK